MQDRIAKCKYAGVLAGLLALAPAAYAADVGVAVNVNLPGIYGQITIGELPAPELLLPRPVIAVPATVAVAGPPPEPLYLHVPPGHEKHWARHCREYDACGRPVYFVSQRWYQEVYAPRQEWRRDERSQEYERDHLEGRHDEERAHEHELAREYDHAHEHDRAHEHGFAHEHGHGHEHDHEGDSFHGHEHERD